MRTVVHSSLVVAIAFALVACEAPTTQPSPPSPPVDASQIVGITVVGNRALTAIGETSQLRAIAALAGGGTEDVTDLVTWTTMTEPSVVRVSKGLVTAEGLGWGQINLYHSRLSRGAFPAGTYAMSVTVTPPGTYFIRGFVILPGQRNSEGDYVTVPGVQVVDTQSGRSVTSTYLGAYAPGWYTLGGLTGSTRITYDKEGYEPAELVVTGPAVNGGGQVNIQQIYRITAGGTVQTTIAPQDVRYAVSPSGPCVNCRLIRVVNPSPGTLHLNLTWNLPGVALNIWAAGQLFAGSPGGPLTADVPVGGGEFVLYVGVASGSLGDGFDAGVTLTLTTSLTAPDAAAPALVMFGRRPEALRAGFGRRHLEQLAIQVD